MRSLADYDVPTRRNTEFMKWWELLLVETRALNLPEVTYGPAKDMYEMGESPDSGARWVAGQ